LNPLRASTALICKIYGDRVVQWRRSSALLPSIRTVQFVLRRVERDYILVSSGGLHYETLRVFVAKSCRVRLSGGIAQSSLTQRDAIERIFVSLMARDRLRGIFHFQAVRSNDKSYSNLLLLLSDTARDAKCSREG